jgi:conjugal transfer pilin signal peptidase TrbI
MTTGAVTRGTFWARFGTVLAVALAVMFVESHLVIPATPSIRWHALWIAPGAIAKGDYANVVIKNDVIDADDAVKLTKRVACVAGEHLKYENGQHFCNGEWLGRTLPVTREGRRLSAFVYDGPIPAGKVYLAGENYRSFDSRYFGFVDVASLTRVTPLF